MKRGILSGFIVTMVLCCGGLVNAQTCHDRQPLNVVLSNGVQNEMAEESSSMSVTASNRTTEAAWVTIRNRLTTMYGQVAWSFRVYVPASSQVEVLIEPPLPQASSELDAVMHLRTWGEVEFASKEHSELTNTISIRAVQSNDRFLFLGDGYAERDEERLRLPNGREAVVVGPSRESHGKPWEPSMLDKRGHDEEEVAR